MLPVIVMACVYVCVSEYLGDVKYCLSPPIIKVLQHQKQILVQKHTYTRTHGVVFTLLWLCYRNMQIFNNTVFEINKFCTHACAHYDSHVYTNICVSLYVETVVYHIWHKKFKYIWKLTLFNPFQIKFNKIQVKDLD